MFIILSYDIHEKRVGKASKIARKYLHPIQRSLYHGNLTEKKLNKLKLEFSQIVDCSTDSVIIYKIANNNSLIIEETGKVSEKGVHII